MAIEPSGNFGESLGLPEQAAQPSAAPPSAGGTGSLIKTALSGFLLGAVSGMGAKTAGESAARGSQAVAQQQQQQQERQDEQAKQEQARKAAEDQRRMQVANYNLNVYKSQIDRDRLDFEKGKEANDQAAKSAKFFMDALKDNPNSFVVKDDATDALHSQTVLDAMKAKGLSPDTAFVYHDPTSNQTLVMSAKGAESTPLGEKASQLNSLYESTIKKYFPNIKGPAFSPEMKMADATLLMDRMNQISGREATAENQAATLAARREDQRLNREAAQTRAETTAAAKPASADERTSYVFYSSAKNANDSLADVESKVVKGMGGQLEAKYAPNVLKDEDTQLYDQGKRQFINAVLRKESGAAIAESEFASADKQYFAQPGDTQKTIQRKQSARAAKIADLKVTAGKVATAQEKAGSESTANQDPFAAFGGKTR